MAGSSFLVGGLDVSDVLDTSADAQTLGRANRHHSPRTPAFVTVKWQTNGGYET
jgi:hypothetical protein